MAPESYWWRAASNSGAVLANRWEPSDVDLHLETHCAAAVTRWWCTLQLKFVWGRLPAVFHCHLMAQLFGRGQCVYRTALSAMNQAFIRQRTLKFLRDKVKGLRGWTQIKDGTFLPGTLVKGNWSAFCIVPGCVATTKTKQYPARFGTIQFFSLCIYCNTDLFKAF